VRNRLRSLQLRDFLSFSLLRHQKYFIICLSLPLFVAAVISEGRNSGRAMMMMAPSTKDALSILFE